MQETTGGAVSTAGPGERCMHLDGRELREMSSGAAAGRCDMGHAAPATSHRPPAGATSPAYRPAKYDSVARRKPARRLACSVSFILADLRLDATMPVRLPWNWGMT